MNITRLANRDGAHYAFFLRFAERVFRLIPVREGGDRRPQLLVDVSVICREDARTGIQRVVRAVWLNLNRLALSGYDLVPVAATRKHGYRFVPQDFLGRLDQIELDSLPTVTRRVPGDIFFALDFAAHILPRRARDIARWRRQGCRVAVMVYDLLPHSNPEWFSDAMCRNFRRWLRCVGRHADSALCISRTVTENLERWVEEFGHRRSTPLVMTSIRLGADIDSSAPSKGLSEDDASLMERIGDTRMLLAVGTIEPRKGHSDLLDAFERASMSEPSFVLVVVGKPGWKTERLQNRLVSLAQSNSRFLWLSSASDELLTMLYERCNAVVAASHNEGFGLPIVEALARGCLVLARDIPVFKELEAEGLSFFPPDSPDELAACMLDIVRRDRRSHSHTKALSWSWEACTEQIADALGLKVTQPGRGLEKVLGESMEQEGA